MYLYLFLALLLVLWLNSSSVPIILGMGPKLIVSVGEDNPTTNPSGPTDIQVTITDESGDNLRTEHCQVETPHTKVFQLNSGEVVAQLDVRTPDQFDYRLRYPELNSNLKLDNYYAAWYNDPDSKWSEMWCNRENTGSD